MSWQPLAVHKIGVTHHPFRCGCANLRVLAQQMGCTTTDPLQLFQSMQAICSFSHDLRSLAIEGTARGAA